MSKISMPRPRYIAFRIDGGKPVSRRALGQALRVASAHWEAGTAPQLTRYEWPHGIVRIEHTQQGAARSLLASLVELEGGPATVVPLSASGTLKALTTRLGILQARTD